MQPFSILHHLRNDFSDYVSSKYPFLERGRDDLDQQLRSLMERTGSVFQDPVLQLVRTREKTTFNFDRLNPLLARTCRALESLKSPYSHQAQAWSQILEATPTVISTGTGSGKSESFIVPVLDGLLKRGYGQGREGIGAIFIYPMNALVQDQFARIFKYAAGTGLRVGIYNGAVKSLNKSDRSKMADSLKKSVEELRAKIPGLNMSDEFFDPDQFIVNPNEPKSIPHILLTNYKMLEYMLLRSSDQPLLEKMDLAYLALDEAHTYSGTLALEMSCLLNRLRVHLGEERSKFLPVATSATLSQGSSTDATEEMRQFFSKLFSHPFPKDKNWLIRDAYERLPIFSKAVFESVLRVPEEQIASALEERFPTSLFSLAKLLTGIEADSFESLCHKVYIECSTLGPQLASILLRAKDSDEPQSSVTWKVACDRFKERTNGSPTLLEALLIVCSHAAVDPKFPSLGLRLHLFARSEPKIFWTLDGKSLFDEELRAKNSDRPSLSFVSCRKCGHMAWAAVMEPTNNELYRLRPLPDFFDEEQLEDGLEAVILHSQDSINLDNREKPSKDWNYERYQIDGLVAKYTKDLNPDKSANGFLRVQRTSSKDEISSDFHSCPSCSATSNEEQKPIMIQHRGSAATDISVFGASVLTNTVANGTPEEDNKERKLLIFADNRQETSFLAGFLTDRHRRLNLRRAITSYLFAGQENNETSPQQIYAQISSTQQNDGYKRYTLAIKLLQSMNDGRYVARTEPLPASLTIDKTLLQNLIPREVLASDWRDRQNNEGERERSYKTWLLENYAIDGKNQSLDANEKTFDLLLDRQRAEWILRLLSDLIALEIACAQFRDGSLHTLGLITWELKDFGPQIFTDWLKQNSDLGLKTPEQAFQLAYWIVEESLKNGQIENLGPSTARHYLGRYASANIDRSFIDFFGRTFGTERGLSKLSSIGRMLEELGGTELRLTWSKMETWTRFLNTSPLKNYLFFFGQNLNQVRINHVNVLLTTRTRAFRSFLTGAKKVAPSHLNFSGFPTGKKNSDIWQQKEIQHHDYYLNLYKQSLASDARLVRAQEHNGMLSATDANEAVRKFVASEINTLVATPTLEMGVDLPDLPTVIHRSVPPDPSNYAQRTGRAGRTPKRAFLLTYCGFGSHDMTFYVNPQDMVSGEIRPPGIPTENTYIIKRHLNGLILEAMAMIRSDSMNLDLNDWRKLAPLEDLVQLYSKASGTSQPSVAIPVFDWKRCLKERETQVQSMLADFIERISESLWSDDDLKDRKLDLKNDLISNSSLADWPQKLESEINEYRRLISTYIAEIEKNRFPDMGASLEARRATERAFNRAQVLAEMHLGLRSGYGFEGPHPISDMAANGFLPSFDFPGRVTRFRGVQDSTPGNSGRTTALKYDRSSRIALREFAPEQKIYGHGFVYRVDRYVAQQDSNSLSWGICAAGCSDLIPPSLAECYCGSPTLVDGLAASAERPELVEIKEVHGAQIEVISDANGKRELNYFTEEVKKLGTPIPDKRLSHKSHREIHMDFHLTSSAFIRTVRMVLNRSHLSPNLTAGALFKELTDSASFGVKLRRPSEGGEKWRPFIPMIQNEGQGMLLKAPLSTALAEGWVQNLDTNDPRSMEIYYRTLAALLERSIQRVLRLNRRSSNLEIAQHRRMQSASGDLNVQGMYLMFIDSEPGGSGVIPMIETYWDEIIVAAESLARSTCCRAGCYSCIKGFENQRDHDYFDKSIFLTSEPGIFSALRKGELSSVPIDDIPDVDQKSPVEKTFRDWLASRHPHARIETQKEFRTNSGKTLAIADFMIDSHDLKHIVHIDGWSNHKDRLLSDIEKRNTLATRGYTQLWIPGAWAHKPIDYPFLDEIFDAKTRQRTLRSSETILSQLPPPPDLETFTFFIQLVRDLGPIKALERGSFPTLGNTPVHLFLNEALENLRPKDYPLGMIGDDLLVLCADPDFLFRDEGPWKSWCQMQTALGSMGYRTVTLWLGPRK